MSLNKSLLDPSNLQSIKLAYTKKSPYKTDLYEYVPTPFKVLILNNIFENSKFISKLKGEISKISLNQKNNDLYSLRQSEDLQNFKNHRNVEKFIEVLGKEIEPLLSKILDVKFNGKKSVTASFYQNGDMLLCHDDKCDDRCVAFVYYLTEAEADNGGAFEMFDHDRKSGQPTVVVKSISPVKNSFLIFEVGDFTYHQVSEVKSDFNRWSINGWFHSNRKLNNFKYKEPFPKIFPQITNDDLQLIFLDEYINLTYCTPGLIIKAQKEFEEKSFMLLQNYFLNDFYNSCLEELKNIVDDWKVVGPPNRRNYQSLDINNLTCSLEILIKLLRSPPFIIYLRNISGLTLVPLSDSEEHPSKLTLEIQKWGFASYTMVTDNDSFFEKPGLDLYLFFNSREVIVDPVRNGGCTNYLAVCDSESDEDDELLNIEPMDNALILVYRTADTVKFTKYINHLITGDFYCIVATYYESNII